MTRPNRCVPFLLAALLATPAWASVALRIEGAVQSGALSPEEALVRRVQAVRAPERLPAWLRDPPATLRVAGAEGATGYRCGTPVLRLARARMDELPAPLLSELRAVLPDPDLRAPRSAPLDGKSVSQRLPMWILTENFSIEWGAGLTNEDGSLPLRDLDGDSVPDVVETWAALFEASYRALPEILDPADPGAAVAGTALETARIPVYLGNSEAGSRLEDIATGTYAFTQEAFPVPYVVVNNDLRFVPPNDGGHFGAAKIRAAMAITAAHELFHVFQFLYLPASWDAEQDDWWLEASSTWLEDTVFDGVNDYYQYFDGSGWAQFVSAGLPVPSSSGDYVTRAYGAVIFAKYLEEHVGGRRALGDVWTAIRAGRRVLFDDPQHSRTDNGALSVYAAERGFGTIEDLFLGFAGANAVMDYQEGAAYGSVPLQEVGDLDFLQRSGDLVPDYLGAAYLLRAPAAASGLRLALTGEPGGQAWGLTAVVERADGTAPVVAVRDPVGAPQLLLAALAADDLLYAAPSHLDPAGVSSGYQTEAAPAAPGGAGPGVPGFAAATPLPGGFRLQWPGVAGAHGYLVRWGPPAGPPSGSRTFWGPVVDAEVRGLAPGTYAVSASAYDAAGREGGTAAAEVAVAVPEEETATPAAAIVDSQLEPPPAGSSGGGGGEGAAFSTWWEKKPGP